MNEDKVVENNSNDSAAIDVLNDDENDENSSTDEIETSETEEEEEGSDEEEESEEEESESITEETENAKQESEEEELVEEEEKEKLSTKEDEITRPSYKEVQKKYPNLFKDFPEIKEIYFRDAAFGNIFTSVKEAEEAAGQAELFQTLNYNLATGNIDELVGSISDKSLPTFSENILFAIRKADPRQYFRAIAPAVAELLHAAYNDGEKKGNRQLQLSVKNLCNFFYDKPDLPKLKTQVVSPEIDAKAKELEQREQEIFKREANKFSDAVENSIEVKIRSWITNGLDLNNEMTDFMKNKIIDETLKKIQELTANDKNFSKTLDLMYRKAAKVGWTDNMKSQIISAYLGRVKDQVGSIRNRIRAEALGRKTKAIKEDSNSKTVSMKPSINKTSKDNPKSTSVKDRKVTASQINMKETSDLDFLNDRVVLK